MLIQPIDYFLLVWFVLAGASTAYIAIDQFRNNPEPAVMRWAFILITLYRVYNKREFLSYFENLGYKLRDSWRVPDLSCDVPFHPRRSISEFSRLSRKRSVGA